VLELREKLWENPVLHVGDDLDVPVWHGRQVCCTSSGTMGTRARARVVEAMAMAVNVSQSL
jgi:hypothetical protein